MSARVTPEADGPQAPAVTFGTYVAPETVREYLPPEPAAPVHFAPAPAAAATPFQTPFGKTPVKFKPDLIAKGLFVLVVFFVAALAGYFSTSIDRSDGALRHLPDDRILQTQTGPHLTNQV